MGSCFSDTIGRYFEERKFSVLSNPHGIIYNPLSIAHSINSIVNQSGVDENLLVERDGVFNSYDYHSSIQGSSPEDLISKIVETNESSRNWLKNTDVIFITLGSAWVHSLKKSNKVVANNLKQAAELFDQKLLTLAEIKESLTSICESIHKVSQNCKIVFTVSPVRHLRHGLIENNRSKARLLESVHEVCDTIENSFYFPSYELVLDLLRDYRFYKKDMVHPNEQATDYVWNYVLENLVHPSAHDLIQKLTNLNLARQHKLMNPEGAKAQKFAQEQLSKIHTLVTDFSYLNLEEEKNYFQNL